MKILFDSEEIMESCNGCKGYREHNVGKTGEGQPVFKCRHCGRLTIWVGGDIERVVIFGDPPVGV